MKCFNCNEEYDASYEFCPHCGTKSPNREKKKCPYCAEWIQQEAIKCRFCGEVLIKDDALVIEQEQTETKEKERPPRSGLTPKADRKKEPLTELERARSTRKFYIITIVLVIAVGVATYLGTVALSQKFYDDDARRIERTDSSWEALTILESNDRKNNALLGLRVILWVAGLIMAIIATVRLGKALKFSTGNWLIAIIFIFVLSIVSIVYMLVKSSDALKSLEAGNAT